MEKLTGLSKVLIAAIVIGSGAVAARTYGVKWGQAARPAASGLPSDFAASTQSASVAPAAGALAGGAPKLTPLEGRPLRVALSEWPGHMALVVGNGGLRTQAGSAAASEGLDLEIQFIEDAAGKNKALQTSAVDFIWTTVDELPIALGSYRAAGVEARAFLQIDWSRGGDACVASAEVQKVEDIFGRKSAMMMFSPDHTVFEFMITNSRLTPDQVIQVRKSTSFSMDDFTFGRTLFTEGKVDVACLWEPDVTLALNGRAGSHRLFSTADATELVADILLVRRDFLDERLDVAEKLARVWFAGVTRAEQDRPAAARLISTTAPRFRDELGYEKTLQALAWVKWTDLRDNVRFFGLQGGAPAFDRVYNQADSIWINYPEAEIKDRFAPSVLRDDRVVRRIWEASGKPAAAVADSYEQRIARQGTAVFTKPVSINFSSASSSLDAEAISIVNQQLLPQLEIARGMYIRVEGNTDSIGERETNQALSERRAQAIVEYLVTRGVSRERLVARGNGAVQPVASNKTPEGRALNRRTDILFIRGSKT